MYNNGKAISFIFFEFWVALVILNWSTQDPIVFWLGVGLLM
jgi:hypothetical protein